MAISRVSIVIPHHGDPTHVAALVDALKRQDSPPLEIIVVDDGSPVACPALPGATVVRRRENGGFGAAVNTGASLATGEYLLVLNSDTQPTRDFLRSLVAAAGPLQPAICSPQLVEEGGDGPTGYSFPSPARTVADGLMVAQVLRRRTAKATAPTGRRPIPVDWLAGAALLVPLATFRQVGGFDERFHMYGEDTDLGWRLSDAGVPSYLLPAARLVHLLGASAPSSRVALWNAAARGYLARKRGYALAQVGALAVVAGGNFAYLVVKRVAGKDVRPLERLRYELGLLRITVRASRAGTGRVVPHGN